MRPHDADPKTETRRKTPKDPFLFSMKDLLPLAFFFSVLGCQESPNKYTTKTTQKPLLLQTADTSLHQCLAVQSPSLSGKSYSFQAKNNCTNDLQCNVFLHYSCTTSHTKTAMTFVRVPQIQAQQQISLQKSLQSCKGSVQVLAHRVRCMSTL